MCGDPVLAWSPHATELAGSGNRKPRNLGQLLSDVDFANARRFHSYDDFGEIELHSTLFIDKERRVRWARTGDDPFTDFDFLMKEIDHVNEDAVRVSATEAGVEVPGEGGF